MDHFHHVDEALKAVQTARAVINRGTSKQVPAGEERDHMKTVATLWFQNLRPKVSSYVDEANLQPVDTELRRVLDSTSKSAARSTYKDALRQARRALQHLRQAMPAVLIDPSVQSLDDTPPSFAPLASDPRMQTIMQRRWVECVDCLRAGAYLAGVIMMGGLLESLFVSKQNRLPNKSALVNATRAPQKKGKTAPLQEWTLNDYIEVGNELGWIGNAAKSVGFALRDYRNLVHPQKEYAERVILSEQDARLLWSITKALIRELLANP